MNREVKFRGKRIKNAEWITGSLFTRNTETWIFTDDDIDCFDGKCSMWVDIDSEVIPKTAGQYVGLKDKSGKEIFEGDIISDGDNILGYIVFSLRYGISVKKMNTTWSLVNFCLDSDFDSGTLSNIKVVGNIHDNLELL